uniref:POPDC1-3 domain-containing protein n=1 Tax=Strigamia maritima TaxID=126957 RepID=T1IVJ8_STRMM
MSNLDFQSFNSSGFWWLCTQWREPQHFLIQLAHTCCCVAFFARNDNCGLIVLHGILVLGFLLISTWAWNIVCSPDVFSWNFSFVLINMGQVFHILYGMRPVKFPAELEQIYASLFQPMRVSRLLFKKLVTNDQTQLVTMPAGEAYATQNMTRTDRLAILITGRANVLSDNNLLHPILARQFLDSPEFEATHAGSEEKFKVSVVASMPCRVLIWQREGLEFLFAKETYLAHIMSILIARDITTKIYTMNQKVTVQFIITDKGSHLDIRLPSVTSVVTSSFATHGSSSGRSGTRCNSIHQSSSTPLHRLPDEESDSGI